MKKTEQFYSQDKQALARRRSEERLHAVQKKQLVENSNKKPSPTHTKHLLRLRDSTLNGTLISLANEQPPTFHFEKTGPQSNDPNFGPMRHDPTKKRRVVVKRGDQYYNVNEKIEQVTPVKQIQTNPPVFVSAGKTLYGFGSSRIEVGEEILQPLRPLHEQPNPPSQQRQQSSVNFAPYTHIRDVPLSYHHLSHPAGRHQPINNRQSQGGKSANELLQIQRENFINGLIESGIAEVLGIHTRQAVIEIVDAFEALHHEHTHLIAAHFGILKDLEHLIINPRDPSSTFVASAALNTEMMLFEKFADFLLYTHCVKEGRSKLDRTIEFSDKVVLVPGTTIAASLTLTIKDPSSGKPPFVQTWDNVFEVTDKPAAAMYTTLLKCMKASLQGIPLVGNPVEQVNDNQENRPRRF